jgi:hypothetical protein
MGMFNGMSDSSAAAIAKMLGVADSGNSGGGNDASKGYNYDANTQSFTAKAKGGKVMSASKRADGIAQRGKTRGKMC